MRLRSLFAAIVLTSGYICCSLSSSAQSVETRQALRVEAEEDNDNMTNADTVMICTKANRWYFSAYADGGGTDIQTKEGSRSLSATGLSWALAGNIGYNLLPNCNTRLRIALSAGLEIRNYNGLAKSTDRFGSSAYDNLHYWYAGFPVMFNLESNANCCQQSANHCGDKRALGYYVQGGVILGVRLYNSSYYSVQGESSTYDITQHYQPLMYQTTLSLGIKYPMCCATVMVGPYATYTPGDILRNTKAEERILSYGLRLTARFDR